MGAPPRWRPLQRQATGEESVIKEDMNRSPIAKQEEGPNLVGDWRCRIRGRRRSFPPDLSDKNLPHLSASPGGNSFRESFSFRGQLNGARLDLHHAF
jgi:hypothetical protein